METSQLKSFNALFVLMKWPLEKVIKAWERYVGIMNQQMDISGFGLTFTEVLDIFQPYITASGDLIHYLFVRMVNDSGMVDVFEMFATICLLSHCEGEDSHRRKTEFIFSLYDCNECDELYEDEVVMMIEALCRGFHKLIPLFPLPLEGDLEALVMTMFTRKDGTTMETIDQEFLEKWLELTHSLNSFEDFITFVSKLESQLNEMMNALAKLLNETEDFQREVIASQHKKEPIKPKTASNLLHVGPIIGEVTSGSAVVLLEIDISAKLVCCVEGFSNGLNPRRLTKPITIEKTFKARIPNVFFFDEVLEPNVLYRCQVFCPQHGDGNNGISQKNDRNTTNTSKSNNDMNFSLGQLDDLELLCECSFETFPQNDCQMEGSIVLWPGTSGNSDCKIDDPVINKLWNSIIKAVPVRSLPSHNDDTNNPTSLPPIDKRPVTADPTTNKPVVTNRMEMLRKKRAKRRLKSTAPRPMSRDSGSVLPLTSNIFQQWNKENWKPETVRSIYHCGAPFSMNVLKRATYPMVLSWEDDDLEHLSGVEEQKLLIALRKVCKTFWKNLPSSITSQVSQIFNMDSILWFKNLPCRSDTLKKMLSQIGYEYFGQLALPQRQEQIMQNLMELEQIGTSLFVSMKDFNSIPTFNQWLKSRPNCLNVASQLVVNIPSSLYASTSTIASEFDEKEQSDSQNTNKGQLVTELLHHIGKWQNTPLKHADQDPRQSFIISRDQVGEISGIFDQSSTESNTSLICMPQFGDLATEPESRKPLGDWIAKTIGILPNTPVFGSIDFKPSGMVKYQLVHDTSEQRIILGPIIGRVTHDQAVVLIEVNKTGFVTMIANDSLYAETIRITEELTPGKPFAFVIRDLKEDRIYDIKFDGPYNGSTSTGRIRTPRENSKFFRAAAVCHNSPGDVEADTPNMWHWLQMKLAYQKADVVLHLGGQVDMQSAIEEGIRVEQGDFASDVDKINTIDECFRRAYRRAWRLPSASAVLSTSSNFVLSDCQIDQRIALRASPLLLERMKVVSTEYEGQLSHPRVQYDSDYSKLVDSSFFIIGNVGFVVCNFKDGPKFWKSIHKALNEGPNTIVVLSQRPIVTESKFQAMQRSDPSSVICETPADEDVEQLICLLLDWKKGAANRESYVLCGSGSHSAKTLITNSTDFSVRFHGSGKLPMVSEDSLVQLIVPPITAKPIKQPFAKSGLIGVCNFRHSEMMEGNGFGLLDIQYSNERSLVEGSCIGSWFADGPSAVVVGPVLQTLQPTSASILLECDCPTVLYCSLKRAGVDGVDDVDSGDYENDDDKVSKPKRVEMKPGIPEVISFDHLRPNTLYIVSVKGAQISKFGNVFCTPSIQDLRLKYLFVGNDDPQMVPWKPGSWKPILEQYTKLPLPGVKAIMGCGGLFNLSSILTKELEQEIESRLIELSEEELDKWSEQVKERILEDVTMMFRRFYSRPHTRAVLSTTQLFSLFGSSDCSAALESPTLSRWVRECFVRYCRGFNDPTFIMDTSDSSLTALHLSGNGEVGVLLLDLICPTAMQEGTLFSAEQWAFIRECLGRYGLRHLTIVSDRSLFTQSHEMAASRTVFKSNSLWNQYPSEVSGLLSELLQWNSQQPARRLKFVTSDALCDATGSIVTPKGMDPNIQFPYEHTSFAQRGLSIRQYSVGSVIGRRCSTSFTTSPVPLTSTGASMNIEFKTANLRPKSEHSSVMIQFSRAAGGGVIDDDLNCGVCSPSLLRSSNLPSISLGPIVGEVTSTSVRILFEVELIENDKEMMCCLTEVNTLQTFARRMNVQHGIPLVFDFDDLIPGKMYSVLLTGCENSYSRLGSFSTSNPETEAWRLMLFGNDIPQEIPENCESTWSRVYEASQQKNGGVDMCLHLGGQVCIHEHLVGSDICLRSPTMLMSPDRIDPVDCDSCNMVSCWTSKEQLLVAVKSLMKHVYHSQWNQPFVREVLSSSSHIMFPSHCDSGDLSEASFELINIAKEAVSLYQNSLCPSQESSLGFWYYKLGTMGILRLSHGQNELWDDPQKVQFKEILEDPLLLGLAVISEGGGLAIETPEAIENKLETMMNPNSDESNTTPLRLAPCCHGNRNVQIKRLKNCWAADARAQTDILYRLFSWQRDDSVCRDLIMLSPHSSNGIRGRAESMKPDGVAMNQIMIPPMTGPVGQIRLDTGMTVSGHSLVSTSYHPVNAFCQLQLSLYETMRRRDEGRPKTGMRGKEKKGSKRVLCARVAAKLVRSDTNSKEFSQFAEKGRSMKRGCPQTMQPGVNQEIPVFFNRRGPKWWDVLVPGLSNPVWPRTVLVPGSNVRRAVRTSLHPEGFPTIMGLIRELGLESLQMDMSYEQQQTEHFTQIWTTARTRAAKGRHRYVKVDVQQHGDPGPIIPPSLTCRSRLQSTFQFIWNRLPERVRNILPDIRVMLVIDELLKKNDYSECANLDNWVQWIESCLQEAAVIRFAFADKERSLAVAKDRLIEEKAKEAREQEQREAEEQDRLKEEDEQDAEDEEAKDRRRRERAQIQREKDKEKESMSRLPQIEMKSPWINAVIITGADASQKELWNRQQEVKAGPSWLAPKRKATSKSAQQKIQVRPPSLEEDSERLREIHTAVEDVRLEAREWLNDKTIGVCNWDIDLGNDEEGEGEEEESSDGDNSDDNNDFFKEMGGRR